MKAMLVKTLVVAHFDYCDVLMSDLTVELTYRLQRAQNYSIVFGLSSALDGKVMFDLF